MKLATAPRNRREDLKIHGERAMHDKLIENVPDSLSIISGKGQLKKCTYGLVIYVSYIGIHLLLHNPLPIVEDTF